MSRFDYVRCRNRRPKSRDAGPAADALGSKSGCLEQAPGTEPTLQFLEARGIVTNLRLFPTAVIALYCDEATFTQKRRDSKPGTCSYALFSTLYPPPELRAQIDR